MPVDFFLNLSLGLILGFVAKDRLQSSGPFASPAILIVGAFASFMVFPVVAYCHFAHTSWTWLYSFDASDLSIAWIMLGIIVHVTSLFIGWIAAALILRRASTSLLIGVIAFSCVITLTLLLIFKERLSVYGEYQDFIDGRALPLWEVKLGYVLVLMSVGVLVAFVFTAFELNKDGRRVRTTKRMTTNASGTRDNTSKNIIKTGA